MTTASAEEAGPSIGGSDSSRESAEPSGDAAGAVEARREPGEWVTSRPARLMDFWGRLLAFPRLLTTHRDLIQSSVKRELEARFKGTILGWLWPLVHPMFLFAVYYFIFTKLLNFKLGTEIPPGQESALGIYMFVGILAFTSFSDSVFRGTGSIVDNGNLIKKLAFPSEILPLNVTLVGLVTLVFSLVVFVLGSALTPIWTAPGWHLLWIPACLLLQGVFTYGLTLLLATLQVFLRDTAQVVGVLLTAWMFGTPLFWVPEAIALNEDGSSPLEAWMPIIEANPMYHCVQAWRGTLMGDLTTYSDAALTQVHAMPVQVDRIGSHLLAFTPWAVGVFAVGYAFFVLCQRRFADEV